MEQATLQQARRAGHQVRAAQLRRNTSLDGVAVAGGNQSEDRSLRRTEGAGLPYGDEATLKVLYHGAMTEIRKGRQAELHINRLVAGQSSSANRASQLPIRQCTEVRRPVLEFAGSRLDAK